MVFFGNLGSSFSSRLIKETTDNPSKIKEGDFSKCRLVTNDAKNLEKIGDLGGKELERNSLKDAGQNSEIREAEENKEVNETRELSPEEKEKIKEETGWSDEVVDSIGSMEEYEVYKEADLKEVEIGGKKCLIRDDIDWNQKDGMGRTNQERAEQGLSPINKDGKVIELHHIGQHADSPLAELTPEQHRGKGNDTILHDKTKESEIDRQAFGEERTEHWQERAHEGGEN